MEIKAFASLVVFENWLEFPICLIVMSKIVVDCIVRVFILCLFLLLWFFIHTTVTERELHLK